MSDISDEIQTLPIFRKLNTEELEYLFEESNRREVAEGDYLFEQDDESSDCFFIVLDGAIGIEKDMRNENELVATMEPGDFFGELGLFSDNKRLASAVATEPATVLEVSQSALGKLKAQHPEAVINLYEEMFDSLAGRFNALAQKAEKTQFWL